MRPAFAALCGLVWTANSAADPCPAIASRQWEITGHLVNRVDPGLPDFESLSGGDEPVTRWYLQLSSPACFAEAHYVTRFQLVLNPEQIAGYRRFLGKQIRVTGALSEGLGAHTTSLVMDVTDLAVMRSTWD